MSSFLLNLSPTVLDVLLHQSVPSKQTGIRIKTRKRFRLALLNQTNHLCHSKSIPTMSAAPPANFNPEEAENLEDVRTSLPLNFTFPVQVAKLSADGEAICRQRFATSPSIPSNYPATDPTIAVQHMTTYWAILEKVRGSSLRLTKMDDEIYEHLKKDFPEFDPAATIDEDEMKSKTGKERWRKFMMAYEKKIDDYNFGTIIRSNPKWEYGQNETIFGKRSKWRFY